MRILILIFFTILVKPNTSAAQYDYGLEVCEKDVFISGRINLSDGGRDVYIGEDAGILRTGTNLNNVAIGWWAGKRITDGHSNTLLGYGTGSRVTQGDFNTMLGGASGLEESGNRNVFLGSFTGFVPGNGILNRDGSVFIGFGAGGYETSDNRL